MVDKNSRILLIDGHALIFRSYYAMERANLTDAEGNPTGAVSGFMSSLFNMVSQLNPTHIAVAFDLPGKTFRHEWYSEYKAGRKPTPPELHAQLPVVQNALDLLGVKWLTYPEYEADDIVATLATQAGVAGATVYISTSDKDAFQLINENVSILTQDKKSSTYHLLTPEKFFEKYQITPQQYPIMAALVGEGADNLPGVPKVGAKTAAKWIQQYETLAGILEHQAEIKGVVGQNLREHNDRVLLNEKMNRAVTDLDLPDFSQYEIPAGDYRKVTELFDQLRFRRLKDQLPSVFFAAETGNLPLAVGAEEKLRYLPCEDAATFASFTTGNELIGCALSSEGNYLALAKNTDVLVLDYQNPELAAPLRNWLTDPALPKAVFDAKEFAHRLAEVVPAHEICGIENDICLAYFLCQPDARHPAKETSEERQQRFAAEYVATKFQVQDLVPVVEESQQGQLGIEVPGEETTATRMVDQALLVRAREVALLSASFTEELAQRGQSKLLHEIEIPTALVLAAMEQTGIAVKTQQLLDLDHDLEAAQAEHQAAAWGAIDDDTVNLNSPKQLQVILFEKLQMPPTRKTKTGFSTNAEALNDLFLQTQNPFLKHLLAYRDVTKLRQIVATLVKSVQPDERIHTTFEQAVAATGRLASKDPNLQNIPARTATGREIRKAFIATPGNEGLLTADYSQIEMRLMAHLSGDEALISAFERDEDLHVFVASQVYDVDISAVDSEMRNKTKAISYGLAYGLSTYGLSRQLAIPFEEADQLRNGYFNRFGKVRDYLEKCVEDARYVGYTETIFGRRRYLPELTSQNRQLREIAERAALNAPIQGSAADIMKIAMIRVQEQLVKMQSKLLTQVHDELIIDIAPGEREVVEKLVIDSMAHAADLRVPLKVSVGFGVSWYDAAH